MSVSAISGETSGLAQDLLDSIRGKNQSEDDSSAIENFLTANDSDSDGQLNLEESGFLDEHFNNADTDGDGYLSADELAESFQNSNNQMGMMGQLSVMMQSSTDDLINSIIGDTDTDGDGVLSQEESGLSDDLFNLLDSDSDGSITSDELSAALQNSVDETDVYSSDSVSVSGGTTESSSSSDSEEDYDAYDLNKDGVVTADELRQAFADGDQSLTAIFGDSFSSENSSTSGSQSALTKIAMKAYSEQYGQSALGSQSVTV